MAYYKTSYLNIPFSCRWECVHCHEKNLGRGILPVRGDTVRYAPGIIGRAKREQRATERSLQGVGGRLRPTCEQFVAAVNIRKVYHKALPSVRPFCKSCGKRQPWQTRNWTHFLLYVMGGVFVLFIVFLFLNSRLWNIDIMSDEVCMTITGGMIALFVLAWLAPDILGYWVDFKMKSIEPEACHPVVALEFHPLGKALEEASRPESWQCHQCGATNSMSRNSCTEFGASR